MKREDARKKAAELVGKMTLEERASQLRYDAPAIKRLGIPSYNWWGGKPARCGKSRHSHSFPPGNRDGGIV